MTDASKVAEALVVQRELRIDASPETVFEFFTDPEKMRLWMGTEAELEPQPGGTLRIVIKPGSVAVGEFVRVERPHVLEFTWGWEGPDQPVPPGSSTVSVTLRSDGDGTILTFRHAGLPTDEMMRAHGEGWDAYLARLAIAAPGGDPGPDPFLQDRS